MKIVLATAPRSFGEIEMAGLPFLGIGYLAAYLEKNSQHKIVIVDAHSENLTVEQTVNKILSFKPQAVGFTATTHNRLRAIEVIKLLKQKESSLLIVVGGPHFSLSAVNALEAVSDIDCVVRREGEETLKQLLEVWPDQIKLKNVLGLTYRNSNGEIVFNPDRPFLNWSQLAWPAWHLYDLSKYNKTIRRTAIRTIGVISGRGCPNHCVFCCNAAYSKSILRLRDPIDFVDELEYLKQNYGFVGFNFWDDTLTISKKHVLNICDQILKRKLNINWYARARVNTVDKEIIDTMRHAGCIRISYGIESGSPRILKIIKKNIFLEQARQAIKWSHQAGMAIGLNFIVNLPEENMEDLKMTADLIKEFKKTPNINASYGFALIYPGTEMESYAKMHGILPENFSWNSSYQSEKYKIISEEPSVPYMEWQGKEIEKVKSFMIKRLVGRKDFLKKAWQKIKRINNFNDFAALVKLSWRYLKQ